MEFHAIIKIIIVKKKIIFIICYFQKKKKIDLEIFFFAEKIKEICFMKYVGMTVFYCAPEIKKTEEFNLTPKADIFSFGMFILIFILFFFFH